MAISTDYQRTGKEAMGSMLRSAGDYRKTLQEISFEWAEFSKRTTSQAIEAQAQLTKKAFATYVSELTRLSMLGLYAPPTREGSSEAREAEKNATQAAALSTKKAASVRNPRSNAKESSRSARAQQRTAAQRASTQRKTGAAKTRKGKRKAPARARAQ